MLDARYWMLDMGYGILDAKDAGHLNGERPDAHKEIRNTFRPERDTHTSSIQYPASSIQHPHRKKTTFALKTRPPWRSYPDRC
jgi:hypothetical protein